MGGPLMVPGIYHGRNRTLFFLHYDGQERTATVPRIFNVPTPAMRERDFSLIGTVRDRLSGQPFPANAIPRARLNASALRFMERFHPLPTADVPRPTQNFSRDLQDGDVRSDRAWSVRVDHNLGSRNTLFGRFWKNRFDFKGLEAGLPEEIIGRFYRVRQTYSAILSDTHVFSPTLVNEIRLGYIRHTQPVHSVLQGKQIADLMGLAGFPAPLSSQEYGGPGVTIPGMISVTPQSTSRDTQNGWDLRENLTILRGNHSFKTGLGITWGQDSRFPTSPSGQFGSFTFDGFASGQPYADFLLGVPRRATRANDIGPYYGANTVWGIYFQDEWKVTRRFTVNWGLRYERRHPFTEKNGRIHNADPATGSIIVPDAESAAAIHPLFPRAIPILPASQLGIPERTLVKTDTNDLAPRFSFAYRSPLAGIVVRGGYGLFYNFEAN